MLFELVDTKRPEPKLVGMIESKGYNGHGSRVMESGELKVRLFGSKTQFRQLGAEERRTDFEYMEDHSQRTC